MCSSCLPLWASHLQPPFLTEHRIPWPPGRPGPLQNTPTCANECGVGLCSWCWLRNASPMSVLKEDLQSTWNTASEMYSEGQANAPTHPASLLSHGHNKQYISHHLSTPKSTGRKMLNTKHKLPSIYIKKSSLRTLLTFIVSPSKKEPSGQADIEINRCSG